MEYLLQMRNWTIICVFNLLQLIAAEFRVIKGVSFRRMNTVKPLEGYWQIAIRFDASALHTLQSQVTILANNLEMTRRELEKTFNPPPFTPPQVIEKEIKVSLFQTQATLLFKVLNNQINGVLEDIKRMIITLQKQNKSETDNTLARKKRSLIGIVGEISEYIFGTVSETTWKEAEKRIGKVEVTNQNLLHFVDKQLTILKHHETRISKIEEKVNQTINTLSIFKKEITNAVFITLKRIIGNQSEIIEDINLQMALQLLSSAIMEISHEFNQLELEFLTLLTKNLPARLLNPGKLIKVLKTIESHLPYQLRLGLEPNFENILYFYSMAENYLQIKQGELWIFLKVPLVKNEEYALFQIDTFPTRLTNTTSWIKINNLPPYIAISNLKYRIPEQQEIIKCQNDKLSFCNLETISHLRARKICAIKLWEEVDHSNPLPKECDVDIVSAINLELWKKISENDFIFSVPQPYMAQLRCKNSSGLKNTRDIRIEGMGLINIPPSCRLTTRETIISSPIVEITEINMDKWGIKPIPNINLFKATNGEQDNEKIKKVQKMLKKLNDISIPEKIKGETPRFLTTLEDLNKNLDINYPIFQTEIERTTYYKGLLAYTWGYFITTIVVLGLFIWGLKFWYNMKHQTLGGKDIRNPVCAKP